MRGIIAAIAATLASKKLWMTLGGVTVLQALFWHSVHHLVVNVPNEKIAAYESMYTTNHYAIVLAILSYLGVQGAVDAFRRTTSTATQVISSFVKEDKTSKEEIIYREELERGD